MSTQRHRGVLVALTATAVLVGVIPPAVARLADGYPTRPTHSAPRIPARQLDLPQRCFGEDPTIVDRSGRVVRGTDGPDVIVATGEVFAGDGDDRVCGSTDAHGQRGDDRILLTEVGRAGGGPGGDLLASIVNEGAQADLALELHGGPGDDLLRGRGTGWELAYGGAGDDDVRMGRGADEIALGAGDDTGMGGLGPDVVYAEAGDDHVRGEHGGDVLYGGDGEDSAYGGEQTDRCIGFERARECETPR